MNRPVRFITPMFLAVLGGLAVPAVFHLVNSRPFRPLELATMRFVQAAVRQKRGWRTLVQRPLLIARMAAVAALAFLGARPYFSGSVAAQRPDEVIVAVDVSGSMARRASDLAREIDDVENSVPNGANVRFVRFADEVQPADSQSARQAVPGAPTRFDRLVRWIVENTAASSEKRVRVEIVSDFARPALETLKARLWPPGVDVHLRPLTAGHAWNAAVLGVRCLTPVSSGEVAAEAELGFYGAVPEAPFEVRLTTDDGSTVAQTVPAGTSRVRLAWKLAEKIASPRVIAGKVTLGSSGGQDTLGWDDARPFAFQITPRKSVLLVDGDPADSPFSSETYFAVKALAPASRSGDAIAPFVTTVRPTLGSPSGFDAVVLANVADLSPADAARLTDFVKGGGGLMITAGSHSSPALEATFARADLPVGRFERLDQPVETSARLATGSDHPLAAFDADWASTGMKRAFQFTPPPGAQSWLEGSDGSPLLAAIDPAGKGRLLLLAHPLDADGNDFPRHPLYVAMVRESVAWLTRWQKAEATVRHEVAGLTQALHPGTHRAQDGLVEVAAGPGESDVASASVDEMRIAFGLNEPSSVAVKASGIAATETLERPAELWPWFAALLFVLLAVEAILARFASKPSPVRIPT